MRRGSPVHAETLTALREACAEVSAAELARRVGCKPAAMNSRLIWLERHGLVVSRRIGRRRLFQSPTRDAD